MTALLRLYDRLTGALTVSALAVLPSLARLAFAGVLLLYYWRSANTKLGEGIFGILSPSKGAYGQIFPRQFEAVSFNTDRLGLYHWAVVEAGMLAEFILPALIVAGLLTRPAALAMIGFVLMQTGTDLVAFGVSPGNWFDGETAGILDQRGLWIFTLLTLVFLGGGPLSLDRLLRPGFNRAIGRAGPAPIPR